MADAPSIALVTCDEHPRLYQEESAFVPMLQARGPRAQVVRWSDASVEWGSFALVVLRSTWDYFERITEFRAWLDRLESTEANHPTVHPGDSD